MIRPVSKILIPCIFLLDRIPLLFRPLEGDLGQGGTIFERPVADARHRVRDRHRGQGGTIIKSITPDARHGVRDQDRGQAAAIPERRFPDARQAGGQFCFRQFLAEIECFFADDRHAWRDDRTCQIRAV